MAEARSSWNKPPSTPAKDDGDDGEGLGDKAKAIASEVSKKVKSGISTGTSAASGALKNGLENVGRHVERALDDPSDNLNAELFARADLPEIERSDPLISLGARLDREADLYRSIAVRQLARAAWMDRLSVIAGLIAFTGLIVLASIAGFRALFASAGAPFVIALMAAGMALLVAGAIVATRVTASVRQSQLAVARDALARADIAEARIHRLASLLAVREGDPERLPEALRAFESDVRS